MASRMSFGPFHMCHTGHFDTILSFIHKKGFEIQYYYLLAYYTCYAREYMGAYLGGREHSDMAVCHPPVSVRPPLPPPLHPE